MLLPVPALADLWARPGLDPRHRAARPAGTGKRSLAGKRRRGPQLVTFVQGRLAHLGCFGTVGEPARRDGTYEALAASAVTAFQQANHLLNDPRLDTPSVVRPMIEFRRLAQPFPFLFGPAPCLPPADP